MARVTMATYVSTPPSPKYRRHTNKHTPPCCFYTHSPHRPPPSLPPQPPPPHTHTPAAAPCHPSQPEPGLKGGTGRRQHGGSDSPCPLLLPCTHTHTHLLDAPPFICPLYCQHPCLLLPCCFHAIPPYINHTIYTPPPPAPFDKYFTPQPIVSPWMFAPLRTHLTTLLLPPCHHSHPTQ